MDELAGFQEITAEELFDTLEWMIATNNSEEGIAISDNKGRTWIIRQLGITDNQNITLH